MRKKSILHNMKKLINCITFLLHKYGQSRVTITEYLYLVWKFRRLKIREINMFCVCRYGKWKWDRTGYHKATDTERRFVLNREVSLTDVYRKKICVIYIQISTANLFYNFIFMSVAAFSRLADGERYHYLSSTLSLRNEEFGAQHRVGLLVGSEFRGTSNPADQLRILLQQTPVSDASEAC